MKNIKFYIFLYFFVLYFKLVFLLKISPKNEMKNLYDLVSKIN
jgi:hypothetical protein